MEVSFTLHPRNKVLDTRRLRGRVGPIDYLGPKKVFGTPIGYDLKLIDDVTQ
jgi:hypothetical protein